MRAPSHRRLGRIGLLLAVILMLGIWIGSASAKEVIPPPPKAYFNDFAGVTRPETARRLNEELKQFERDTSNQIVVAVYPSMQTDSSIDDYAVRIAHSWRVGQKDRDNGAVLFVFIKDRKMYIQVGYGLEGVLTDFRCHRIINDEIKPRFKNGDFDGGLTAGVRAMMAAAKGEYAGTGKTVAEDQQRQAPPSVFWLAVMLFFGFWLFTRILRKSGFRGHDGWGGHGGGGPFIFTGGGSGGFGGGGSSFGGGGGDSGGFSGGGGSFGGGGAGGDW